MTRSGFVIRSATCSSKWHVDHPNLWLRNRIEKQNSNFFIMCNRVSPFFVIHVIRSLATNSQRQGPSSQKCTNTREATNVIPASCAKNLKLTYADFSDVHIIIKTLFYMYRSSPPCTKSETHRVHIFDPDKIEANAYYGSGRLPTFLPESCQTYKVKGATLE